MSRSRSSRRQKKTLQDPRQSAKRITAAIVMTPVEKTSLTGATTLLVMTGEIATIVPQLQEAIMIAETVVAATAVMLSTGKTTVDTGVAMTLVTGAAMIHAVVPVVLAFSLALAQLLPAGLRTITSTMVEVDAED